MVISFSKRLQIWCTTPIAFAALPTLFGLMLECKFLSESFKAFQMQITRNILPFPAMCIYEPGPYHLCCLPLRKVIVTQQLNINSYCTISCADVIRSLFGTLFAAAITCASITTSKKSSAAFIFSPGFFGTEVRLIRTLSWGKVPWSCAET